MDNFKTKEVMEEILARFMKVSSLGADDSEAISDYMAVAMMKYMPLRALAIFGGKDISRDMIEDLVDSLNEVVK